MKPMDLRDKTILVTGGAGFIGSHVAKKLITLGAKVVIVDNLNGYYDPELKNARLTTLLKDLPFKLYKNDIAEPEDMERIFSENKIDLVCHEAAQAGGRYSLENPDAYIQSNIVGTHNIFKLAKKYGSEGVIFASSSSVYGDSDAPSFDENARTDQPVSLYAATKKATELIAYSYFKNYGVRSTALRYFTVYGPWGRPDMALFKFTKAILAGEEIEVYNNGELERDFTYVDDIVDGTIAALETNSAFEVFNLGCGNPRKLMEFIDAIENALGVKAKIKYLPHQNGDVLKTSANIAKAKNALGWSPKTPIEEGVKMFTNWYREYYGV